MKTTVKHTRVKGMVLYIEPEMTSSLLIMIQTEFFPKILNFIANRQFAEIIFKN